MATFTSGLRTPFARYWLSSFPTGFVTGTGSALLDTAAVTCMSGRRPG